MDADEPAATVSIDIDANPDDVWFALTDPAAMRRYMFGTVALSDWRVGSPVRWSNEQDGHGCEDHGEVLEAAPGRLLRYTHVATAGQGQPERRHLVTVSLAGVDDVGTRVTLVENGDGDETSRRQSERKWSKILGGLKLLVEQKRPSPP